MLHEWHLLDSKLIPTTYCQRQVVERGLDLYSCQCAVEPQVVLDNYNTTQKRADCQGTHPKDLGKDGEIERYQKINPSDNLHSRQIDVVV